MLANKSKINNSTPQSKADVIDCLQWTIQYVLNISVCAEFAITSVSDPLIVDAIVRYLAAPLKKREESGHPIHVSFEIGPAPLGKYQEVALTATSEERGHLLQVSLNVGPKPSGKYQEVAMAATKVIQGNVANKLTIRDCRICLKEATAIGEALLHNGRTSELDIVGGFTRQNAVSHLLNIAWQSRMKICIRASGFNISMPSKVASAKVGLFARPATTTTTPPCLVTTTGTTTPPVIPK